MNIEIQTGNGDDVSYLICLLPKNFEKLPEDLHTIYHLAFRSLAYGWHIATNQEAEKGFMYNYLHEHGYHLLVADGDITNIEIIRAISSKLFEKSVGDEIVLDEYLIENKDGEEIPLKQCIWIKETQFDAFVSKFNLKVGSAPLTNPAKLYCLSVLLSDGYLKIKDNLEPEENDRARFFTIMTRLSQEIQMITSHRAYKSAQTIINSIFFNSAFDYMLPQFENK